MLEKVSARAVEQLTQEIVNALRIFVTGENFSGLTMRMIAMRLMHLECQVYVVGATITPTIMRAGDLLIACCESGSTSNVCAIATKARNAGIRIVSVTTQAESALSRMSDVVIDITAAAKQESSKEQSRQFAGSLFEQSTLLLFDVLFYVMVQNLNLSVQTLWALHTNLE